MKKIIVIFDDDNATSTNTFSYLSKLWKELIEKNEIQLVDIKKVKAPKLKPETIEQVKKIEIKSKKRKNWEPINYKKQKKNMRKK